MEIQELHEQMEKGFDRIENHCDNHCGLMRVALGELRVDIRKQNGSIRDHKWNIRGLWAVFLGSWAIFMLWLRQHVGP